MKDDKFERVGDRVSIFRRDSPIWQANYQFEGRQVRKSLKTTSKKEARRKALLIEGDLARGHGGGEVKPPSLNAAADLYLEHVRVEKRASKTLSKYTRVCAVLQQVAQRQRVRNALGIDLRLVDAYRQQRVNDDCAEITIYHETVIIRQLVNFLRTRRLIQQDPLHGLKLKRPKPAPQPCWSPDQIGQILATAKARSRVIFTLLAESGLRIGELQWLTWDDVDFDNNVLLVRPKEGWKPKTGDERAVPMSPAARRTLEELPRVGRWVVTASLTRKHPQRGRQISERRALRSLKRVLKRVGLPGKLHTFRHAFVSRALLAGIPEAVVRSWVGHVDREVIRRYTHIADVDSQSAMRRLSEAGNIEARAASPDDAAVPQDQEPEDPSNGQ